MSLYKLYNIISEHGWSKTSEPIFIQEEVDNLKKALKTLQVPVKTIPFYPLSQYKTLQKHGEQDKQYWKEITIEFIKQKHNANISRQGFLIEMFIEGLSHELFFIILTLWGAIIIGPTKKLDTLYVVEDLAFLN